MDENRKAISFSEMGITSLLDRQALNNVNQKIQLEIDSAAPGTILSLDLLGVQHINSSGTDEVIGRALLYLKQSHKEVFMYVLTEQDRFEHFFNLKHALYNAELPLMICIKNDDGTFIAEVTGPIQPYLHKLLVYVYTTKSHTINSLTCSMDLGISKQKSSTYLAKLFELHLIYRKKTTTKMGYEYVYSPLF